MRSAIILVVAMTTACTAGSPGADGSSATTAPTRAECIVAVQLVWDGRLSSRDRSDFLRDAVVPALSGLPRDEYPWLAGSTFPGPEKKMMYIQFSQECEARLDLAAGVIENVGLERLSQVRAIIKDEIVRPGPQTIDLRGPDWSDS